jgi:hypothetical protein
MNRELEWALGYGYVRSREHLHRLEEAALASAPQEILIAEATNDFLRLQGSNIDNREQLLEQLHRALSVSASTAGVTVGFVPVSGVAGLNPPFQHPQDADVARQLVRQIRHAINEYRDESRHGIVRARLQLRDSTAFTALLTYLLFVFSLLAGAPLHAVVSAASFFLVGAVVGLFNRLYLDGSAQTAIEDYGLSRARLLHTPLFCGLAALGGSILLPLMSVHVNPTLADTASGQQAIVTPTLASIFNVTERPFSLLLAAVFGLTPSALISRLQNEAEKHKSDLKNSEAPAAR